MQAWGIAPGFKSPCKLVLKARFNRTGCFELFLEENRAFSARAFEGAPEFLGRRPRLGVNMLRLWR